MNTDVIILAQGTQRRLGQSHGPKQLLPLRGCGGTPILARTVRQIWVLAHWWPTIVTWDAIRLHQEVNPVRCGDTLVTPAFFELPDPGNSSLKGISRLLEQRHQSGLRLERTIVLLGDVVYSWRCLESLIELAAGSWGFAGTSDLSPSGGELWGVAWHRNHEDRMMSSLRDAMLRHPPFEDEYQPGQMRRWITGWQRGDLRDHVAQLRRTQNYVAIDDYTFDVDLPKDLLMLPSISSSAAEDDAQRGITWTPLSTQEG